MKHSVLKIPQCLQQAEIVFDTQNKNGQIFLSERDCSYLTAFVEIRIPVPESMEVIELMDVEIREFFFNMTNGFLVGKK